MDNKIRLIENPTRESYAGCFISCLILTHDNRLLLQKRPDYFHTYPSYLCTFGGRIEADENPSQALVRELQEELEATVDLEQVIFLGSYTEKISNYQDIIYGYFWHDKNASIGQCHEGIPVYFDSVETLLRASPIIDDVSWLVMESQRRNLL